ncbi:hypothetical protein C3941_19655 [Kaistia algarum]|uniref:hypothetical protein n=1 Tax=Kaistia algarum TaxID=2083279 RepID=UPI000CE8B6EB|nr:hypothetical protein [Kaistia algarum]MCX5516207.1 hypothetical protein [Kaistia algarum]PPE78282.1 hypothetical protein C3941_19655 [Kaistia algarum]
MQKRSLSRQLESTRTAIRIVHGGTTPRPSERAMIAEDLECVLGTLQWLQANEEMIRKIKAEQGDAS